MLTLDHVIKAYSSQHTVLNIPSFQLSAGLYWLTGENGSGKTTLLKLLAGLIPFHGDVSIGGVSIRKEPTAYRQRIHYVEAEPLYPPYLTGNDLLHFHRKTRQANLEQMEQVIQTFHIKAFIDKPVGTYSSGMVKRLSLALVFLGQSQVILLDEPLVTLDVASQTIMQQTVADAVQRQQVVIFTSHQPLESDALPPYQTLSIQNQTVCFV